MQDLQPDNSGGSAMESALDNQGVFDRLHRVAEMMATAKLVPEHLQGSVGDCFMVVQQAYRWRMDPFAVAQKTFVVSGKLGYEGQLVAAVVNSRAPIVGRLSYEYDGSGENRSVTVSGTLEGDQQPRKLTVRLGDVQTGNKNWTTNTDQMLAYRGARDWARRHTPEVILGVYTQDELEEMRGGERRERDVTPASRQTTEPERPALPAYEQTRFDENLGKWQQAVEAGKTTPEEIVAKVESKYQLTEEQRQQILNLGQETAEGDPIENGEEA